MPHVRSLGWGLAANSKSNKAIRISSGEQRVVPKWEGKAVISSRNGDDVRRIEARIYVLIREMWVL